MAVQPGYLASVRVSNTSTAVVDQGMSDGGDQTTWYTTNSAQNVWDPTVTPTFEDNGVAIPAGDIASYSAALGKVTFTGTKVGPITMTGNFLEMHTEVFARGYSASIRRAMLDATVFGDTAVDRVAGLIDAGFTLESLSPGLDDLDGGAGELKLANVLLAGTTKLVELNPDGGTKLWRIWCKFEQDDIGTAPDDLVGASISGQGVSYGGERSVHYGDVAGL